MLLSRLITLAVGAALLSGCAATNLLKDITTSVDHDDLYLRGAFTWWEADEAFRVESMGSDVYKVTTELIADGKPYEFRFVDRDWTPGSNCGYKNENLDQIIHLGQVVAADCNSTTENFKFTPPDSGYFDFYIDFSQQNSPVVYIEESIYTNPS